MVCDQNHGARSRQVVSMEIDERPAMVWHCCNKIIAIESV
jgi:hypothetical protein